jgi:Ca2+-binding RTX toxin-like protein
VIDRIEDQIIDESGNDTVRAAIDYEIGEGIENLELIGLLDLSGAGNDGANKLVGNSGDNELDGREGADTLTGGDGDDGFVIGDVRSGLDVITDFGKGDDVIFLDALDLGLFNPDALRGYSGVVAEADFESVSKRGQESDQALFVFDQSTSILSMVEGDDYLELVAIEGPRSDDLLSSDLYVLL